MVSYNDATDSVTSLTSVWINTSLSGNDAVDGKGSDSNATDTANLVASVVVGTVLTAVVLCTVTGNVMVLLAVFVNSNLRSTTNYFIVNLAIADLLLGTTVLPFSASLEVFKKWLFGQVFCDIWAAIDVLCCTASIFSLCVISIDRYIGVTRPLQRSAIMTESRAVYVIIFIWLLAMAISIAPLVGWKEPPSADPYECTVTTQTGYVVFSVSASFYIPLSIILLVYFRIYREAMKHSRFLATGVKTTKVDESGVTLRVHKGGNTQHQYAHAAQHHHVSSPHNTTNAKIATTTTTTTTTATAAAATPPEHQSSSSSDRSVSSAGNKIPSRMTMAGKVARFKRETKAAKTLGIVVGVFILCWFPFFFILPLGSLCDQCNIPPLMFNVFFWLGYCNSLMNPVIYACSSREFQFAFRRILRCQYRRRPRVFLKDQESSSCHEFSQIESRPTSGRSYTTLRRSNNQSKTRKNKFTRTFKSHKHTSSRLNSHISMSHSRPIKMQSFGGKTCSSGSLHNQVNAVAESPTDSLRALQLKVGAELRRNNSSVTNFEPSDWSPSGNGDVDLIRRESVSNEDLFEDLTKGPLYPTPCNAR